MSQTLFLKRFGLQMTLDLRTSRINAIHTFLEFFHSLCLWCDFYLNDVTKADRLVGDDLMDVRPLESEQLQTYLVIYFCTQVWLVRGKKCEGLC